MQQVVLEGSRILQETKLIYTYHFIWPFQILSTSHTIVRIQEKVEKFGIHEYQKIWYAKSKAIAKQLLSDH